MEKGIGLRVIDHVTIVAKDLDATRKFYTQVLGVEEVERPAFGLDGIWFQAGSTQIHVNIEGADAGKAGLPHLGASPVSNGFHFAFEVDDCDAAAAQLAEQGIELFDGPRSRPDGARQVYLRDPDGHLLEICSGG